MNFITFKINNIPHIVSYILYDSNKKIIDFYYIVLNRNTKMYFCYEVKDMKEFNYIKNYITTSLINGNSFYKNIDIGSIKAF